MSQQDPSATYTLDGERTKTVSELCKRLPNGGLSCLKLDIASRELFAIMQKLDYFCTLPQDPSKTYSESEGEEAGLWVLTQGLVECKPIPKG